MALSGSGSNFASTYNYASTSNQVQTVVTGAATRTLSYGATGNITGDDFGTGTVYGFAYDQSNRLVQSTSAAPGQYLRTNAYEQDFLGQRVSKNFGNLFDFHYDRAGHLLAERVGTSAYFSQYVWLDDLPLAFIAFGSIDYIHGDHLGTPQKMTDGSQSIVWDGAASDPFMLGQLPGSPMNLRFPGQYFDSETGLHHNGLRDYDPTLGRYIESDPIGLAGGINTYAYVRSNPLGGIDSHGTDLLVITGGATSGNPFGHSSVAVTGAGVYSFGTGTPPGSSVTDFLEKQSTYRDSTATVIHTTPAQDEAALKYLRSQKDNIGYIDNCASRTLTAMEKAGVPLPPVSEGFPGFPVVPGTVEGAAEAIGEPPINVPQGTLPNSPIYGNGTLGSFNPSGL